MAELTVEQKRALALANARLRLKNLESSIGGQLGTGLFEGASAVGSMVVDIPDAIGNAVVGGIDRLFGTDLLGPKREVEAMTGGSLGGMDRTMAEADAIGLRAPEPQGLMQSLARRFGQEAGASAPFLGMGVVANPAGVASRGFGGLVATDTAANAGAAIGGEVGSRVSDNPVVEDLFRLGGGVTGGILGSSLVGAINRGAASRDYVNNAPTTDELSAAARAKYEEGHSLGLKIKPAATAQLDTEMRKIAADSGLITPTGRIIDNADVKQAFSLLEDFQKGNVDTRQLQSLRSIINDIAGSPEPKLSRVGVQMKRTYDTFLEQFAPQFKEGNALNTRAMRGEMMDRAEELADIRASQFSQSGTENALRTEFRQLDRDIARGNTRGLRPDQIAAVQDVSRGTAATNAARQVGKMAPRGVVSAGFHSVPFMVGNALGGPGLGATLAGGTMATGILGQSLATLLQRNAAARASAAMRQAAPLSLPPRMAGILGMVPALAGQATTQGPR